MQIVEFTPSDVARPLPLPHAPLPEVFAALSDPCRLALLFALTDGERNVTDLTSHLCRPQPTISHHLRILRQAGLVRQRRAGKMIYYALREPSQATDGGLDLHTGEHVVRIRDAAQAAPEATWRSPRVSREYEPA